MKKIAFNAGDFSAVSPNPSNPFQVFRDISNPTGVETMLGQIIFWLLFLAGTLAFISLLYGSLKYLPPLAILQRQEKQKTILYAIIGVVIIMCIMLIITFVATEAFKQS